jgi:hypothetical protein
MIVTLFFLFPDVTQEKESATEPFHPHPQWNTRDRVSPNEPSIELALTSCPRS